MNRCHYKCVVTTSFDDDDDRLFGVVGRASLPPVTPRVGGDGERLSELVRLCRCATCIVFAVLPMGINSHSGGAALMTSLIDVIRSQHDSASSVVVCVAEATGGDAGDLGHLGVVVASMSSSASRS